MNVTLSSEVFGKPMHLWNIALRMALSCSIFYSTGLFLLSFDLFNSVVFVSAPAVASETHDCFSWQYLRLCKMWRVRSSFFHHCINTQIEPCRGGLLFLCLCDHRLLLFLSASHPDRVTLMDCTYVWGNVLKMFPEGEWDSSFQNWTKKLSTKFFGGHFIITECWWRSWWAAPSWTKLISWYFIKNLLFHIDLSYLRLWRCHHITIWGS